MYANFAELCMHVCCFKASRVSNVMKAFIVINNKTTNSKTLCCKIKGWQISSTHITTGAVLDAIVIWNVNRKTSKTSSLSHFFKQKIEENEGTLITFFKFRICVFFLVKTIEKGFLVGAIIVLIDMICKYSELVQYYFLMEVKTTNYRI